MKMKKKLHDAMDNQVTLELEASMVYLQLSYQLDALGLVGMRDWMKIQSDEELVHAQLFANHMLDREATPTIGTINVPELEIKTAADAFEAALKHEQMISEKIRGLAKISAETEDYDSRPLIDQFLSEQIEEESSVSEILDRLRLTGNDGSGLLRIDGELGQRPPADEA